MLVVGLTGGIGAGKTTVSQLFSQHHIPIIDADTIARAITAPGHVVFESIIEHFGNDILHTDHSLNRALLRKIVFEDDTERKWLETTTHPFILDTIKRQIEELANNPDSPPYCIIVIPLLFESRAGNILDRVLVIDTSEAAQLTRTRHRDNLTSAQIKAIMNAQLTREERLALADDVIENTNDLGYLKIQVEALHVLYSEMGKTK